MSSLMHVAHCYICDSNSSEVLDFCVLQSEPTEESTIQGAVCFEYRLLKEYEEFRFTEVCVCGVNELDYFVRFGQLDESLR